MRVLEAFVKAGSRGAQRHLGCGPVVRILCHAQRGVAQYSFTQLGDYGRQPARPSAVHVASKDNCPLLESSEAVGIIADGDDHRQYCSATGVRRCDAAFHSQFAQNDHVSVPLSLVLVID